MKKRLFPEQVLGCRICRNEKVTICNIATGTPQNGVKPSMESTFHLGILRERPDVNVVFAIFSRNMLRLFLV